MKRRLFIAAVFLLAAAVVNVAIAWWCAIPDVPLTRFLDEGLPEDPAWWEANVPEAFPDLPIEISSFSELGVSGRVAQPLIQQAVQVRTSHFNTLEHLRCGWPALAFEGWYWDRLDQGQILWRALRVSGSTLPFNPIWPGFAINTFFYAAVLWLLICGPFTLRRYIRMQRGRCVKCGYPMGESAVCSECGEALPGRAEAAI